MSLENLVKNKQYKTAEDFDAHYFDEIARRANIFACIQCGTCTASCESGRWTALKTRQIVRKVVLGDLSAIHDPDIWLCTTCYQCYERCPRDVRPTDVIIELRNYAAKVGNITPPHLKTIEFLMNTGHGVPINDQVKKQREELGLPPLPPTIYKYKLEGETELTKFSENLFTVAETAKALKEKKEKEKSK
jgi:heterodisulfide reductase subunit C